MEEIDLSGLDLPEKERKILQAAIGVFSEKGFSASTTNEIAKNAGVAEGTIFRYYKTKKDILRAILIQAINLFSNKIVMVGVEKILEAAENKDLYTLLKDLLHDRLKLVETFFPMFRVILTEAIYHEDVRESIYKNISLKTIETVGVFQERMVKRGLIRSDISATELLRSAFGSLAVLIGQKILMGDKFPVEKFEAEADIAIDILLNGLAPRNPDSKA
jgi:AcrR family transcriptional regulator